MGRKKIKIQTILDEKTRLVTFAKRKNGLFKKAYELSVLCGCEIALLVFTRSNRLYQYSSSSIEDIIRRRREHPSVTEVFSNNDIRNGIIRRSYGKVSDKGGEAKRLDCLLPDASPDTSRSRYPGKAEEVEEEEDDEEDEECCDQTMSEVAEGETGDGRLLTGQVRNDAEAKQGPAPSDFTCYPPTSVGPHGVVTVTANGQFPLVSTRPVDASSAPFAIYTPGETATKLEVNGLLVPTTLAASNLSTDFSPRGTSLDNLSQLLQACGEARAILPRLLLHKAGITHPLHSAAVRNMRDFAHTECGPQRASPNNCRTACRICPSALNATADPSAVSQSLQHLSQLVPSDSPMASALREIVAVNLRLPTATTTVPPGRSPCFGENCICAGDYSVQRQQPQRTTSETSDSTRLESGASIAAAAVTACTTDTVTAAGRLHSIQQQAEGSPVPQTVPQTDCHRATLTDLASVCCNSELLRTYRADGPESTGQSAGSFRRLHSPDEVKVAPSLLPPRQQQPSSLSSSTTVRQQDVIVMATELRNAGLPGSRLARLKRRYCLPKLSAPQVGDPQRPTLVTPGTFLSTPEVEKQINQLEMELGVGASDSQLVSPSPSGRHLGGGNSCQSCSSIYPVRGQPEVTSELPWAGPAGQAPAPALAAAQGYLTVLCPVEVTGLAAAPLASASPGPLSCCSSSPGCCPPAAAAAAAMVSPQLTLTPPLSSRVSFAETCAGNAGTGNVSRCSPTS